MPRAGTISPLLLKLIHKNRFFIYLGMAALCLVNTLEIILPLIFAAAIDKLSSAAPSLRSLSFYAFLYIAVTSVQAIARITWRYVLSAAGTETSAELRRRLLEAVVSTPPWLLDEKKKGDILALTTNDADSVSRLFDGGVITLMDSAFWLLTVPALLIYLDPIVGVCVLTPLLVIPWIVRRNDKRIRDRFLTGQRSLDTLSQHVSESFANIRTIKTLSAYSYFSSILNRTSDDYARKAISLSKTEAMFGPSLELVSTVSFGLLFLVGGFRVIDGALTVGSFIAVYRYISQLAWPLQATALVISLSQRAQTSASRIETELAPALEVDEPIEHDSMLVSAPQALIVDGLNYSILDRTSPIISDLSFSIAPGERVALIGEIGSGKSTLIALLHGIIPRSSGEIFIGNSCYPAQELRLRSSWMSQEPFLFEVSIRENLLLSQGDHARNLLDEEIWMLLAAVSLEGEVKSFGDQLGTVVGERGVMLSGGQRQRLALARALAKSKGILLLDDPFSAIDVDTEEAIIKNLSRRSETILFSTHRLSSLALATRVLVLSDGKIVEDGTQAVLERNKEGLFSKFLNSQFYRSTESISNGS